MFLWGCEIKTRTLVESLLKNRKCQSKEKQAHFYPQSPPGSAEFQEPRISANVAKPRFVCMNLEVHVWPHCVRSNKLKTQGLEQRKVYCKGQASSTGSGSCSKDPRHQLFLCWPWIRTLWLQRKLRNKNRDSDTLGWNPWQPHKK